MHFDHGASPCCGGSPVTPNNGVKDSLKMNRLQLLLEGTFNTGFAKRMVGNCRLNPMCAVSHL